MAAGLTSRGPGRWWPPCRRLLFLAHRWLGIAGCLLFAMWFASGLVMMYVGFPSLTDAERLHGLAPLSLANAATGPAAALAAVPGRAPGEPPASMRLEMMLGEPVWRIVDARGQRHTVSARDGRLVGLTDASRAQAIVRAFSASPAARWAETLERDQWTVPNGLNPLRPLHRIEVGDVAGTELYVSARTGEVVRDTTRHERFWNWLGSVPHWIYFTPLRADPPLWHVVVTWLSGLCIASALTGLVLGILRVRLRRRYPGGSITPYRRWMAWHHVAGLVFGAFVLTWIVSGWLSMNPNGWFDRDGVGSAAQARYEAADPQATVALPHAVPADARELELAWFSGRPSWCWRDGGGAVTVVDASGAARAAITRQEIERAVGRAWPGVPIAAMALLTTEDAQWYGHHDDRVLPVWRVELADAARTWLYLDPASGRILGDINLNNRAERWLFNAPHTLDLPGLNRSRPLWDLVMWTLCLAGLLISVSGVVIGTRRLRATFGG